MEQTNARYLDRPPDFVEIITVDASFISLKKLLPVFNKWFRPADVSTTNQVGSNSGDVIALIKPQFEAGRQEASRGRGVIRDSKVHRQVLMDILSFANQRGYRIEDLLQSPLTGPKGNIEFLAWMIYINGNVNSPDHRTQQYADGSLEKMTAEVLL